MMGITDGLWVSTRAAGMCMVQIGALVADSENRSHPDRDLLPLSEGEMIPVLKGHIDKIRGTWNALPIGLNAVSGDIESALRMARSFAAAGGDIFELNCHGGSAKFLERGLLRAMMDPDHRSKLHDWLEALCELPIPVVVKFNGTVEGIDFTELLDSISLIRKLFGVHFNVRDTGSKGPNIDLVRQIRPLVAGVLFCSGYVSTADHVSEMLAAGADCVGVAEGLRTDAGIIEALK